MWGKYLVAIGAQGGSKNRQKPSWDFIAISQSRVGKKYELPPIQKFQVQHVISVQTCRSAIWPTAYKYTAVGGWILRGDIVRRKGVT